MTATISHLSRPLFAEVGDDVEVSFEVFPPRNRATQDALRNTIAMLEPLQPRFVSVTCGAAGSTRASTRETVDWIAGETQLATAAHMTCVGARRQEIDDIARGYWDSGIRHIVALRGDAPKYLGSFPATADGYSNAAELVAGLRAIAPFEISVAAYPEIHPESADRAADLDNLKAKLDAGATRAITQFFFSPDSFFRFEEEARAAGIQAELVPGILPISNIGQTRKFAATCGATIPAWLDRLFEGLDSRPMERQLVAATIAAELCGLLYARGVRHFHFYTLNRPELASAISHLLGIRPRNDDNVCLRRA
jgi:methylenetetrahydrofolate reductase (NADPH)